MTRAFLIGAGATRAQYDKAPLSSDFFEKLSENDSDFFNSIKTNIYQFIREDLRKLNIEDVLIKAEGFPQSIENNLYYHIFTAIYKLLAEPTKSDMQYMENYISGNTTDSPTIWGDILMDNRLSEDDFFLSLNYDLFLDREIIAKNKHIDYGLGEYSLSFRDEKIRVYNSQIFSVYHLHGALNWEIKGKKIQVRKGAINPSFVRSGPNICIVPPGRKDIHPLLKDVWDISEKRLKNADEIIIIGCSLNIEDKQLLELIRSNIKNKKIKIISKSEVGGMNPENINFNYKKILDVDFQLHPYGFKLTGPEREPNNGAVEFIFS